MSSATGSPGLRNDHGRDSEIAQSEAREKEHGTLRPIRATRRYPGHEGRQIRIEGTRIAELGTIRRISYLSTIIRGQDIESTQPHAAPRAAEIDRGDEAAGPQERGI